MNMLFILSLLGLTFSLVAWQLWKDSEKSASFGIASFAFLILASLSMIFTGAFTIQKLGLVAVSLLCLAFMSFIASSVRHISLLRIPFLALSCFAMFKILMVFPITPTQESIASISQDGELIVKIDHEQIAVFNDFAKSRRDFTVRSAFSPSYEGETELDDYFVVDLQGKLDAASPELNEFIEELKQRSDVEHIELNEVIQIPELSVAKTQKSKKGEYLYFDPMSSDQWALAQSKMNNVFKLIKANKPDHRAKLFILDTGVDAEHPDLQDVVAKTSKKNDQDKKGHGTHCAGIAGAMTGNGIGISSYNADGIFDISSIKVLADYGGGTQQGIINGMIKAVDSGADVISMSLGGRSNDSRQRAYNEVVEYANRKNVIILVAAGNSSANAKFFCPANSKGVITVAAIDQNMNKATFSNTLEDIEMGVSAPGVDILSTTPSGKYERFSGTSMATPFVAGLVTTMKCYKADLTTQEAFQLLNDSGIESQSNETKNIVNPGASLGELLRK